MKQLLILSMLAIMVMPSVSLAHPNHAANTPAHPTDSPDYHEVATTSSVDSVLAARLALLLQLVTLLQEQFALLTGDTAINEDTDAAMSSVATGEITTVGTLTMTTDSNYRYFSSDGLPEYDISNNQYASQPSAQDHDFRVPLNPEQNASPMFYELPFAFGIALNGVTFEPFAAEWYQDDRNSGWQEDPFVTLRGLDVYNAHVQPNGMYHYHGQPTNLFSDDYDAHSPVIGFAADGFPLYGPYVYQDADDATSDITKLDSSYDLKSGTRPDGPGGTYDGTYNEDYEYEEWGENALDECDGRYGITPEYPDGTYYYVATESFPYIPRCLWGDMDSTFIGGPGAR